LRWKLGGVCHSMSTNEKRVFEIVEESRKKSIAYFEYIYIEKVISTQITIIHSTTNHIHHERTKTQVTRAKINNQCRYKYHIQIRYH
jgi:hypothetical protein